MMEDRVKKVFVDALVQNALDDYRKQGWMSPEHLG